MKKLALFGILLFCFSASPREAVAKVYVAEPMLIPQPSFAGMTFYVYRPYNFPKGWYLTFDGYPVVQTPDKVWVYGQMFGTQLTPTSYIVGSVNPGLAGLTPYADKAEISSVVTMKGNPQILVSQPLEPAYRVPPGEFRSTYMPDWAFDSRFTAIGGWRNQVDRMGILHKPNVPVAWKGERPKVIFVWTGANWYQIKMQHGDRPVDALRRELYSLVRMVNSHQFRWYAQDTPVLTEYAVTWGYYWMGEVVPSR